MANVTGSQDPDGVGRQLPEMVSVGPAGPALLSSTCRPTVTGWLAARTAPQSRPEQLIRPPPTWQAMPQALAMSFAPGSAQEIDQPVWAEVDFTTI